MRKKNKKEAAAAEKLHLQEDSKCGFSSSNCSTWLIIFSVPFWLVALFAL